MPLVSKDWTKNKYGQHVLKWKKFTGYVEDDGEYFVHFDHSDGNLRTVAKGRNYLGVREAQRRVEKALLFIKQAIEKQEQRGKLNATRSNIINETGDRKIQS